MIIGTGNFRSTANKFTVGGKWTAFALGDSGRLLVAYRTAITEES